MTVSSAVVDDGGAFSGIAVGSSNQEVLPVGKLKADGSRRSSAASKPMSPLLRLREHLCATGQQKGWHVMQASEYVSHHAHARLSKLTTRPCSMRYRKISEWQDVAKLSHLARMPGLNSLMSTGAWRSTWSRAGKLEDL